MARQLEIHQLLQNPVTQERKHSKGLDLTSRLVMQGWNLRHLDTLLDRTLAAKGCELPGVSTPYLYFGMWRSTFAW